jgi:hypothetical protein
MSDVICGRCVACCKRELVPLQPGDDMTLETRTLMGFQVLKQKENGDCFYLGKRGCTIYDRRPQICRAFDCRKFVASAMGGSYGNIRKDPEVVRAGMERMRTLTEEDM